MNPSGKILAGKKHRVRTRQTRSGLLRQTFAEKKRRVPGQADKESNLSDRHLEKESSGSAQTDFNWSIQTDTSERNVGYQFRQTQSEILRQSLAEKKYWVQFR